MDLLEEMERQQKGLSDENAVLRTENESYQGEIGRLTAILAAREQVTIESRTQATKTETTTTPSQATPNQPRPENRPTRTQTNPTSPASPP